MKIRKGVYYFSTRAKALAFANNHDLPKDRIIEYLAGWAIQKHISGPYYGPNGWNPKPLWQE